MSSLIWLVSTRVRRFAAAALSAVLLYFTIGLTPFWPAAWLAPIPLLFATFAAPPGEAALMTLLAVAAASATANFSYFQAVMGTTGAIIVISLQALAWLLVVGMTRRSVRRSKHWVTVLVFPVLWAGLDTVLTAISPHSSWWGNPAYGQLDFLPVLQIAALAGSPGVLFVLSLFASAAAIALYRGGKIHQPGLAYGLALGIVALTIVCGEWRLLAAPDTDHVMVGIVAIDDYIGSGLPAREVDAVWSGYADAAAQLAAQGAKIAVLPEKIAELDVAGAEERRQFLAGVARKNGLYLVVGLGVAQDNLAWVFDPSGETIATYVKHHLVPGLEMKYTPGTEYVTRNIGGRKYGVAICKDMHFPSMARTYGRQGVDAMLVPAWDFYRDRWLASRLTAFRGVESGFTIVRSSREGTLSVSDRYGRFLAAKNSAPSPGVSMAVSAPVGHSGTPYAVIGDTFGWLCVAGGVAMRLRLGRKSNRPPTVSFVRRA